MSDKNPNPDTTASSNSVIAEVLRNRNLTWTILIVIVLILAVLTVITVLAFAQGRKVSIFGLEIEAVPTNQANSVSYTSTPPASNNLVQITDPSPRSIEDFPGEIFNFSSNSGYGELHVIHRANDDFDYLFYYNMPQSGDGYAGIFFRFTPTVNFTDFASLQVTVSFGDENAICEIYLEDQVGRKSYIALWNNKLVNASADARMEIEGNHRVFTIPIAGNFLDVPNKQSIAGIGISINTNVIRGSHSCTIQQIYLLK